MATSSIFVAVVDDDVSVRKALGRLLTASSFEINTYSSAREFLKSLSVRQPDCLVIDLHMPELTGIELQHQLTRAGVRIPTIVITASTYEETGLEERCKKAGATALLFKPLHHMTLVETINSAVANSMPLDASPMASESSKGTAIN